MLQSISIANAKKPPNHWQVLTLCWLFAILYGVWLLPHTVFARNFCLVVGALLSLPIIATNWRLFFQRAAAPIWLIAFLLIWITIHLFFIGQEFNRQYLEYVTIWKRVAIGCVFALGLGLGIGQTVNQRESKTYWAIIYFGLLLPLIIYFAKYCLGLIASHYTFILSPYLYHNSNHTAHPYGVSRAVYVFFCLPAMAIGLGCIVNKIKQGKWSWKDLLLYVSGVPFTLLLFSLEGDRLGAAYGLLLIGIFCSIAILYLRKIKRPLIAILAMLAFMVVSMAIVKNITYDNSVWRSLWADAKIASQVDRYDGWQTRVMPLNELGNQVNVSNYERISWAIVGWRLLVENPLGYGLMSLSFSGLGSKTWPNAQISWTHSAWLDFGLGYGFPALAFTLFALVVAWRGAKTLGSHWNTIGRWGLSIAAAVMLAKEISTEVVVNAIIFMIVWVAALRLEVDADR